MKRQHSRWSSWTVVLAANALVDEETPADRADVHAGVVVSRSAEKLTGGTHQAPRPTSDGVNPPIQHEHASGLLADLLRPRPATHRSGLSM